MIQKFIKYFLLTAGLLSASGSSFAQLNWNQAGKFTGTVSQQNYLTIPNASEFNNVDQYMISMWVNMTTQPSGYFQFVNKGSNYQVAYDWSTGLYMRNSGNSDLDGPTLNTGRWYHIASIIRDTVVGGDTDYKVRELYVDGVRVNKDAVKFPGGNTGGASDSLKIGSYGAPNFLGNMNGSMDDVQMWLGTFYPEDVARGFRTSLAAWGNSNNYYTKCILSITFQDDDNSGAPFQVVDESRYAHSIRNNGVTASSLSSRPSVTTSDNLSIHLSGSQEYLAAPDHLNNSPDNQVTLEAWIYPEKTYSGAFSDLGTIICKGSSIFNYRLYLGGGNNVYAMINGNSNFSYAGSVVAPQNQWSHVAFTYDNSGAYSYYLNGALAASGTNNVGNIVNGTDSLYIGQASGTYFFQGYIDELRISGYVKDVTAINSFLYKSMDLADRPGAFDLSCYNFDGNLANNNGGGIPRMYFRNNVMFSSRYVTSIRNFPVSPMVKADNMNFPSAWYLSNNSGFRIPASGSQGSSQNDYIYVPYCTGINDLNVFLALEHTFEKDITVYLVAPSGDSIELVKNNVMERGQVNTIFNEQADSSISDNRFASFSPQIKPFTSLNAFTNQNAKGSWKLRVQDSFSGDTGRVYKWGFQLNNLSAKPNLMIVNSTANSAGFWGGSSQPTDTVRIYLRQRVSPFARVDSAIAYINQFGFSQVFFGNAVSDTYFLEYTHRNSLTVWTNSPNVFVQGGTTNFSFLSGPSTVYGGNLISIDGRWCLYSGDINQDGAINGNDFTILSQQFGQSGYINSDLNGDNTVNGNDFTIFNTGFGKSVAHP